MNKTGKRCAAAVLALLLLGSGTALAAGGEEQ